MIRTALLMVALAALLYGLHRIAMWAEDRGWIYYRKGHGRSSALSGAALELQSLLQPAAQHVVEERRRAQLAKDDAREGVGEPGLIQPAHLADDREV